MLKIRPLSNRLIFNMGIPIPGKRPLYILRRDPESFILKKKNSQICGKNHAVCYSVFSTAQRKRWREGMGYIKTYSVRYPLGYLTATRAIIRLRRCKWSNPGNLQKSTKTSDETAAQQDSIKRGVLWKVYTVRAVMLISYRWLSYWNQQCPIPPQQFMQIWRFIMFAHIHAQDVRQTPTVA